MRQHPRRLSEAGISPERYGELQRVCRQLPEYRERLRRLRAGIVDKPAPSGAWRKSDPTGNRAMELADNPWARRIRIIEDAAREVAPPVVARAILFSVSNRNFPYELIEPKPPCGRRQFYRARLDFYIELDRRMWQ